MHKRLIRIFAISALAWMAVLGCSKNDIDTAKIRQAFQSVSGPAKDYLDQGLSAIDQTNYIAAVHPLKKMAYTLKLDNNQRLILEDTIAKVEAKAAKQKK
ncbi:MAG TPA: hypothetical protein VGO59_14540 [Verrucomicrobiae bacterium]|jgi:cytochrome c-type biogenesis protein CcmH/NrfG